MKLKRKYLGKIKYEDILNFEIVYDNDFMHSCNPKYDIYFQDGSIISECVVNDPKVIERFKEIAKRR